METQYDPVDETLQYLVANQRYGLTDPLNPVSEPVITEITAQGIQYNRIPNFDDCPDRWGV